MGRLRRSLSVALAASALLAAPSLVAADAADARATPDAPYTFASSPETETRGSYDAGIVKPASVVSAQTLSVRTNVQAPTMLRSADDTTALAPTEPAAPNAGDATTAAPESTTVVAQDASAIASNATVGSCPAFNELTTACSNVCGNNALCFKYRSDGRCVSGNITKCVHPVGDPCAYECLEGTSADFDQWSVAPFGVPSWDISLRNNKMIEAMRALDVPRNITQLSFQFLFNETDAADVKGKVAVVEFPDQRLVANSSSIYSLALLNIAYRKIPAGVFTPQLQNLVLENCLLTEVPKPVLALKSLSLLNMASNYMSTLPSTLANLPLTALFVDYNELTEFPSIVKDMSSLKLLSLIGNLLTNVTTVIPSAALTELSLDFNQLTDFAGVIPSLQKLFLRGNSLTTFPSSLSSLTNLLMLDLTANAMSSQAIDNAAATLTHPALKELYLNSNGLHAIPDLGNLFPVLKTLSVRNNTIETVQGTYSGKLEVLRATKNQIKTFTASFSRLTVLDLCENKLDALPDIASISSVLQSINVSKNGLEKLVDTKPLTTLTSFNASNNNLTDFDLVIPSLRMLDLCKNKFKTVPKAVWTYNVLDELHLGGNPELVELVFEPDQYYFLKRLSVFTMDATSVKKDCPESWRKELKNVTVCVRGGLQDQVVDKNGGNRAGVWTYVSLTIGSIAAIALVAFVFVLYRRRREYEYDDYKNGKMSIGSQERTAGLTGTAGSNALMRSHPNGGIWDDEELQERRVDYDSIKLESKLAAGAYGEVWIGTYRNESVAVKKLSDSGKRDKTALAYFVGEIKLLAQLDHPRIVHFYGVAWTCMTDLCAVIEFLPGGDLYSLLRTHVLPNTHWNAAKLQIALDTVEALTYVHTLDEILIHRDLKSRNVLLDDDIRAKVTDFGISRYQRDEDTTMTSGMGTGRWMAPEIITGRGNYNEKVDIYSFGVILSELDTHQMPYALNISNSAETHVPLTEMAILQQVAAGELQPNFSPTCPDAILDIAHKCLSYESEDRPSALQLAYMLRQLIPMFPQEDAPARPSSTFSRSTWNRSTNASVPGSTRRGLPVVDRQSSKQVRGSGILLTRSGPGEKAEFRL